jgi:HEAT repeats
MKFRFSVAVVAIAVVLSPTSRGSGLPHLDVEQLVHSSDVVAIMDVETISPIRFAAGDAQRYVVSPTMRNLIKGSLQRELPITFSLPSRSVGYSPIQTGRRVLFLHRVVDHYEPANPYYPDFPAVGESSYPSLLTDAEVAAAVFRELSDVLASPASSQAAKMEVLLRDYALPTNEYLLLALQRGVKTAPNDRTREALQAESIIRGDLSELPDVSDALLRGATTPDGKSRLLYSIGNRLHDMRALGAIESLFKSTDPAIRVAAAKALWHIADPASRPLLVKCLVDSNREVRYYSVRALADITGQNLWGPSLPEWDSHEQKYLKHWREWAASLNP